MVLGKKLLFSIGNGFQPLEKGRKCPALAYIFILFSRFTLSAPIIHYFYIFLEKFSPKKDKSKTDAFKRLIIDRFIFTPPFILLFLYVVPQLEVSNTAETEQNNSPTIQLGQIKKYVWFRLQPEKN